MVSPKATGGDVRAAVENLLGAYARLCDERDTAGLGGLLSHAVLTFGAADPVTGSDAIAALFERAFAAGHRTRHQITNAVVTQSSPEVVTSRVAYTRWVLDPSPSLVGMGEYESEFVANEADWCFAAHTVRRDWVQESPA
jgi:3-phenylpropionate/cinnamic acid dioxygenase small subunit